MKSHHIKSAIIWSSIILLAFASIWLRLPADDRIFYNADATYHVLLTMKAFEETPASIHHYLPIVSLGAEADKGIPWGATIPDRHGNYYYTSFSSAGFLAPYIFVKMLNMPMSIMSLYAFNSTLYILCLLLTVALFLKLFKNRLPYAWIVAIAASVYLFQPEIMHGQGIVYWHQSLFQLLFLMQMNLFVRLKSMISYISFLLLCLLVPYVEWTGYVSNAGFALAFLWGNITITKSDIKIKTGSVVMFVAVIVLTACAFVIFVGHFLTVVPVKDFALALASRFMERNIAASFSILPFLKAYAWSFGLILFVTGILSLIVIWHKKFRKKFIEILQENQVILFVMFFALIENIIMKQHACGYGFDRMKCVFPILFVILACMSTIKHTVGLSGKAICFIVALVIPMPIANFLFYINSKYYFQKIDYLNSNITIANTIKMIYTTENSILIHKNVATRGYSNLLFGRGIYEFMSLEEGKRICNKKQKQYLLVFRCNRNNENIYNYASYFVFDTINDFTVFDSAQFDVLRQSISGQVNLNQTGRDR